MTDLRAALHNFLTALLPGRRTFEPNRRKHMNERDNTWWNVQDQDDVWVQKMVDEEREKRLIDLFNRLYEAYKKDNISIPTQLELPLEDTRAREEIEAEYDAFMERLEREEREHNTQEKQS